MSAETVPVQKEEVVEEAVEQVVEPAQQQAESPAQEQAKEEQVPLSALQKERRKRQEIEQELKWHKEQMMAKRPDPAPEADESLLEAATKEDLGRAEQRILRSAEERVWIKANPDKAAEINEKLPEFLKQRPNLARAIEDAPNRYEEAWMLMDALTPKQKAALRPAPIKKEAPGSPAAIPKAAAINQAVDVMSMSDSEFNAWRQSQRKRR